MKIAIHHRENGFSERWIEVCRERNLPFEVVDGFRSDIVGRLRGFDAFLWHAMNAPRKNVLAAGHVLYVAELMGLRVFPNHATFWHFDDKIAQKYLLESIGAPLPETNLFFDEKEALEWMGSAKPPLVMKLRNGAASSNVRLVRTRDEGRKLIHQAFGKGFRPVADYLQDAATKYRKAKRKGTLKDVIRRAPRTLSRIRAMNRELGREGSYIYFQEFIPNQKSDTRITVVGDRAFAYVRIARPNDFRASGSGQRHYEMDQVDPRCVRIAHEVAAKLGTQSLAFDFVFREDGTPCLLEVSFGFVPSFVWECPGQWDRLLKWHEGHVWPQDAILDDLLAGMDR